MDKATLFIPLSNKLSTVSNIEPIRLKRENYYKQTPFMPFDKSNKKPYFAFLNKNIVAKNFITAIAEDDTEETTKYISKSISNEIDIDGLYDIFKDGNEYKLSYNIYFDKESSAGVTTATVINKIAIIHLKMVFEPDIYSKWKICGVDREYSYCTARE